jgi:hypothetical protein
VDLMRLAIKMLSNSINNPAASRGATATKAMTHIAIQGARQSTGWKRSVTSNTRGENVFVHEVT